MTERRTDITSFLVALKTGLGSARLSPAARSCADAIWRRLEETAGEMRPQGSRVPACGWLADALAQASVAPGPAAIAGCFSILEPSLTWRRRDGGPNASPNIMEGHGNAMVIGPGGLEERDDVWIGISLLAPHTRYPDHRHPPEEVYYVLSPGLFRQGDGEWFEPGAGGVFHNPPGIWHAMRSEDAPLLAAWILRPDHVKSTKRHA